MIWRKFAALAVGLVLAACDVSGLVPQEHQDFAKRVVTMVQMGDGSGLQAVSDPALWQQLTPDIRARMSAIFPAGEQPVSVSISKWHSNFNNGYSVVEMTMLYKYSRQDVEVNIGFNSGNNRNVLTMIYVKPVTGVTPPPTTPTPAPLNSGPTPDAPKSGPGEMPQQPQEMPQPQGQPQDNSGKSNSL